MRLRSPSSRASRISAAARASAVSSMWMPETPSSTISGSIPRFVVTMGTPRAMASRTARQEPSDPGTRKIFASMLRTVSTYSTPRR